MQNMTVTANDVARLLQVAPDLLKKWIHLFEDYLSPSVTWTVQSQAFTLTDVQVLALISEHKDWEEDDDGDYSSIFYALNSGEHHDERYQQIASFCLPVFQEPPEGLNEDWTHGVLVGGMTLGGMFSLARAFKYAGDVLVQNALSEGVPHSLTYPILFNYRHAVELYLKIATRSDERKHEIQYFAEKLKCQQNAKLNKWAQDYLDQLQTLDKRSTTFRYGDDWPETELWVDLKQLKRITGKLSDELESLIFKMLPRPIIA